MLECSTIRGHDEAMLIHVHRSTTLSNDRKTENRPDLGAAPPSGPIKEGYPSTHWQVDAHVRTQTLFLFLATYAVCVIRSCLCTREMYVYTGVLSGTRSLSLRPPLSLKLPYLYACLRVRRSHMHWHVYVRCMYYMYTCIYVYTREYGNSPPSPEICK